MNSASEPKYPWYYDDAKDDELLSEAATTSDCPRSDWNDADDEDDWPDRLPDELFEPDEELPGDRDYHSPKEIYECLSSQVWNQEEAKRTAAMLTFNALFRHIKQNAFFVGPTGCGKTHIWRCLQEMFPDRIHIVDASHVTNDGWKGSTKWSDLLSHPMFSYSQNTILVLDEADKFLAPKYSSQGENVSRAVAGEGLKLVEGTTLEIGSNRTGYSVDTSLVSFVFCGAFSTLAETKVTKSIGFGNAPEKSEPYSRPITETELIQYGVLPELMGRIQWITNLAPMTEEDYFLMTAGKASPVERIQRQYKVSIDLTESTRRELAAAAASSGLGVRGMENSIRRMLDEAMFEDCSRQTFEL